MTDFKIIDKDGIWVKNVCVFPMADGFTQNVFVPGLATKVAQSEWLKLQMDAGILQPCASPLAEVNEADKSKLVRKAKEE